MILGSVIRTKFARWSAPSTYDGTTWRFCEVKIVAVIGLALGMFYLWQRIHEMMIQPDIAIN